MDERMDMRNNVLYNWGGNGCYGGENMNVNIVNNYYKPGPATAQRSTTIQRRIAGIGIPYHRICDQQSRLRTCIAQMGKILRGRKREQ